MNVMIKPFEFAMYLCRACGAEVAYPQKYVRCPVCGIKWG